VADERIEEEIELVPFGWSLVHGRRIVPIRACACAHLTGESTIVVAPISRVQTEGPIKTEGKEAPSSMHRPIGVTLLAVGAGLAVLAELWRMLVFLGVVSWTFVGQTVKFDNPQWGQAFWALILAAIWAWVAIGFWNVRYYAWTFGTFIALFTLIWGFFALLFGSSMEAETIPWLLAGAILLYLYYPGVRDQFVQKELSLMTPEQRAALEQMQAANAAMANATRSAQATPPVAPPPAAPPPAAPPSTPSAG